VKSSDGVSIGTSLGLLTASENAVTQDSSAVPRLGLVEKPSADETRIPTGRNLSHAWRGEALLYGAWISSHSESL
jgi:hypothetical protein